MDLTEFLTARYDEDEQLARHAAHIAREAGTRWVVGPARYVEDYEFVSIHTAPPNVIEVAGSGFDGTGGIHGLVYAEHIVRHDPARVLADIAAKRRMLKLHFPMILHKGGGADWYDTTRVCGSCVPPSQFPETAWPCLTARTLALPYAEHPDYDPAWTVTR